MGTPKKTQNKAIQTPKKAKEVAKTIKCACGYVNEAKRTRCYACNREL